MQQSTRCRITVIRHKVNQWRSKCLVKLNAQQNQEILAHFYFVYGLLVTSITLHGTYKRARPFVSWFFGRHVKKWELLSTLLWHFVFRNIRLRLKSDGTRAENRFRLSAKRTSPFKSAGASVQSTTGSRGSNAGYCMFRGRVKSINTTRQSITQHFIYIQK